MGAYGSRGMHLGCVKGASRVHLGYIGRLVIDQIIYNILNLSVYLNYFFRIC